MFSISDTMMTTTTNGATSDNNIHLLDPSLPNFSFTSFSRLPSLRDLLDPEDDFDFFIQQPDPAPEEEAAGGGVVLVKNMIINNKQQQARGALQMKQQPSKRDRHSKIVTARGLRDRRMRLSLEVAKKFFGLQDLLGYEKASKTVEWLLLQANAEINKLSSHVMDFSNNNTAGSIIKAAAAAASKSSCNSSSSSTDHDQKKNKKKKVIKAAVRRRSTSLGGVARDELRAKARERAKARTMAKKIKNQLPVGRSGEEEEEEEGEEESVVRKSSTASNIIMMLANINQQDDHNQFLIPQQEGDQVVNGLISSFGQSWEASL